MSILKKIKHLIVKQDKTEEIISFWEKGGADFDYYAKADQKEWIQGFWEVNGIFYRLFENLDVRLTLEIACGTARHSAQVIENIEKLYLLDSSMEALSLAKKRFQAYSNVIYIHNSSGLGISPSAIANNSLTAVFSYDAMVHFEQEAVESYIIDSYRVLQPGAYALFHHSNYDKNPTGRFTENPGWRNYMSKDLFQKMAVNAGFEVIESQIFSQAIEASDCVTLLKKPGV